MRVSYLLLCLFIMLSWSTAADAQRTENVFLITLDGFRWEELFSGIVDSMVNNAEICSYQDEIKADFGGATPAERRQKLLPFMWDSIGTKGQLYGNRWLGNNVNVSNFFWFSYPGYNEILSGYSDTRINSNSKIPNPNETVLEWVNKQPAFRGRVAAFGSWDVFDYIVNEQRSGIPVNCGYETAYGDDLSPRELFLNEMTAQAPVLWNSVRNDFLTHHYMLEYVKRQHPRLVYISYGETDDFAHDGAYNRYLYSAHQTDQMIGQLWHYLQSDPVYAGKTTLLITTDHGRGNSPMTEWKSHGKTFDGSDAIWFAVIGPDTPALGEVKSKGQFWQNQVAKTVAAFLGLDYTNAHETPGKTVDAMLSGGK